MKSATRSATDWAVFGAVMLAVWIVPLWLGGFYVYLGCMVAIYAIAALGLQLMVGLAGQLSLGHAAFLALGAYATVIAEKRLGLPYPLAAAVAVLLCAAAGLLMAQLIRLSGVYFKIATLGFGIIMAQIISNWSWLTGGHSGLRGFPPIDILGMAVTTRNDLFMLEAATLTVVYALLLRLSHGRMGRAFRALGQDPAAARSIGIPVNAYRMMVITVGCGVAGIAGGFLPHLMRSLNPDSFTWYESLILLIMITVGGLGSLPGAIVGAAVLIVLPEYLRDFAQYKMLIFGILLILSMALLPSGIAGFVQGWSIRLAGKLRGSRA